MIWVRAAAAVLLAACFTVAGGLRTFSTAADSELQGGSWTFSTAPDSELQRLFALPQSNPHNKLWLGADCDTSIPLGGDAHVWLFGDTLVGSATVAPNGSCTREYESMPRNGVGIATKTAHNANLPTFDSDVAMKLDIFWENMSDPKKAASFFHIPEEPDQWLWVMAGVSSPDLALLVLQALRLTNDHSEMGFRVMDTEMIVVDYSHGFGDPLQWKWKLSGAVPYTADGNLTWVVASTRNESSTTVFILGNYQRQGAATKDAVLCRVQFYDLAAFEFEEIEYWVAPGQWLTASKMPGGFDPTELQPLFSDCPSECTLEFHPLLNQWYLITNSYLDNKWMIRCSPELTGPWGDPVLLYEAPLPAPGEFIYYAAKSHPELAHAQNEICWTYETNCNGIPGLLGNCDAYIPQVMRTIITSP